MSENTDSSDDRLWQAFRYVTAEMTVQESEHFESKLADDEQLCNAVIDATRLIASQSVTEMVLQSQPSRRSSFARQVATVATLCGCLVFVAFLLRQRSPELGGDPDGAVTVEAESLIDAWVDGEVVERGNDEEPEDSMTEVIDVPDWMIAAVSLSGRDDDSDMPDSIMPDEDDMELF